MRLHRPSPRVAAATAVVLMAAVLGAGSASAQPRRALRGVHGDTDQARDRDRGREPHVRQHLRDVQATARAEGARPPDGGDRDGERQPGQHVQQAAAVDGERHLGGRLHDRAEAGCALRDAAAAEHHVHRSALRRRTEHEPARRALPGRRFRTRRTRSRSTCRTTRSTAAFKACDNGAYVGDPLHRFYQMNQQTDQNQNKLCVWTAETAGDSNGAPPADTDQGAVSMGFYNVQHGDAPVFDYLAKHFSMSDNYHQAVMGGTGTNHVVARQRPGRLVRERGGSTADAAGEPDREPERPARVEQLLHPGRLRGRDVLQVLRPVAAGRRRGHRLPARQLARRLLCMRCRAPTTC